MILFGWISSQNTRRRRSTSSWGVGISYTVIRMFSSSTLNPSRVAHNYSPNHLTHRVMREPEMQDWISMSKPEEKKACPLSEEMELAIDRFFFNHYCQAFRNGAFARANCSMCVIIIIPSPLFFFFFWYLLVAFWFPFGGKVEA